MNKSFTAILIGAGLLVAVEGMVAQESPKEKAKEAPVFRLLGLGVKESNLFYTLNGTDVPVAFAEDYRSPFYQRPEGGRLELYSLENQTSGEVRRTPAFSVDLPEKMQFPLVIVSRSGQSMAARILDDGEQAFPGGAYRILNQLDYDIGVALGQSRQLVRRGGDVVLADRGGEERTRQVQVFRDKGSKAVLLFSNNWAFSAAVRTLVVVNPGTGSSEFPFVRRIVEPVNILQSAVPMSQITPPASSPSQSPL